MIHQPTPIKVLRAKLGPKRDTTTKDVGCKDSHLVANLGNATNGVLGGVVGFTVACFFVRSTQPSSSAWARRPC